MTCFVDNDINSFRVEVLVLENQSIKPSIVVEVDLKSEKIDLWTIEFDGTCCRYSHNIS